MKKIILLILILTGTAAAFSQNVGIGTTDFTPTSSALLELRSTNSGFLMPRLSLAQISSISGAAEGLLVYQTNGAKGFKYYDGASWLPLGGGGSADNLGNHTAEENVRLNDFWLSNDGGNKGIKITDDGKVGFGSADPAYQFHLVGVGLNTGPISSTDNILARFEQNSSAKGAGIQIKGIRALNNVSAFVDLINYDYNVSNEYIMSRIAGLTEDNGEKGAIVLYTNSGGTDDSGLTEKVRITSDGKLGIGVTNPTTALDIDGQACVRGLAGSGTRMVVTDANGNLSADDVPTSPWSESGSNVVRTLGQVGIGTSTPETNLDLYGNGTTGFTLGGTTQRPNPGEGPEIGFGRGGFGKPGATIQMIDYDGYSAGLAFNVHRGVMNGAGGVFANNWPLDVIQALTIVNNGRVGIGTSDPNSELEVAGGARITDLAGSGTRMVVADANGDLSTQAIPSGGGGTSAYGVNGTSNQSTSSTSFSNVNDMSLSLTAGTYIFQYNSEIKGSNGSSRAEIVFYANGGTVSSSSRIIEPDNNEEKTTTVTSVVTVNSTQTVRVRFRKYSGSGSITVGNRCFTAIKL